MRKQMSNYSFEVRTNVNEVKCFACGNKMPSGMAHLYIRKNQCSGANLCIKCLSEFESDVATVLLWTKRQKRINEL
jgi:DNA-directed RNA polymerase subunit RPC12/RpoP